MNIRNPGQDGAGKGSAPENTGAGKAAPVHMYRVSLLILFFMMGKPHPRHKEGTLPL